jgi:hypothetical protein
MLREISPRPLRALRVELFRPMESAGKEFSILLGCPVIFGCERESIFFSSVIADEKSQRSNEEYYDLETLKEQMRP